MKAIGILIIALIYFRAEGAQSFPRQFIYWENLSPKQQSVILNSNKFPDYFITFYNRPSMVDTLDDRKVFSILDSIVSNVNSVLQPFYYNLFVKMCSVSDGYIGEMMGSYSIKLLLADPEYVINHIRFREVKNKDSVEFNYMVQNISFEYQASLNEDFDSGPGWLKFTSLLKEKMVYASEVNKRALDELLIKIKQVAEEPIEGEEDNK